MNISVILLFMYRLAYRVFSGHGLSKFYLVKVIDRFISSHFKTDFAKVQGHKMFLDPNDSLGLSIYGVYAWESFMTKLVKEIIKKGDIVLDLGANIGYYTLIFAKLVGNDGQVIAFEPSPDNFALLKKNIEINGYKNVILEQKAISNKTERTRLYLSEPPRHTIHNSTIYNLHKDHKSIKIESIRLDNYFKTYNKKVNFVKMDIEGAEYVAIQGMSNLLKENKNVKIVTEFNPFVLKEFGVEPVEYLKLLLAHGFKLYNINDEKKKLFDVVNISELLKIYTPEKRNFTNLLCVRSKTQKLSN